MDIEGRKQVALDFLGCARRGDRKGAEGLLSPGAKHHNPWFRAGMPALLDALASAASPDRRVELQRVIAEGDYVVVHSHVRQGPSDPGTSVVHIFRFEGEGIAELWDLGQAIPKSSPNSDGMF